jgi:heterodisulfide reductase subunit B
MGASAVPASASMKKYSSISVAILANSFFSIAEEMWAAAVTADRQCRVGA